MSRKEVYMLGTIERIVCLQVVAIWTDMCTYGGALYVKNSLILNLNSSQMVLKNDLFFLNNQEMLLCCFDSTRLFYIG